MFYWLGIVWCFAHLEPDLSSGSVCGFYHSTRNVLFSHSKNDVRPRKSLSFYPWSFLLQLNLPMYVYAVFRGSTSTSREHEGLRGLSSSFQRSFVLWRISTLACQCQKGTVCWYQENELVQSFYQPWLIRREGWICLFHNIWGEGERQKRTQEESDSSLGSTGIRTEDLETFDEKLSFFEFVFKL